jgi:hypothetical protein
MSRSAHPFKQGDLTTAIKALMRASAKDGRVEIVDMRLLCTPD